MTSNISFDLSELLSASRRGPRYYGIARVVSEVAKELVRLDVGVRFFVHIPAFDDFFEIIPRLADDGHVDLGLPEAVRQLRLRQIYPDRRLARDTLVGIMRPIVNRINRRRWGRRLDDLSRLDMNGRQVVTFTHPRIAANLVECLERRASDWRLFPMIHDMIPVHDYRDGRAQDFPWRYVTDQSRIVSRAYQVLANSQFTADDVARMSQEGILPPIRSITTLPLVHECPEGDEPPEQLPPSEPYLLTVGATPGRKNLEIVFEALKLLQEDGHDIPLLCLAGARSRETEALLADRRYDAIRDRIVLRIDPNQTDLVALYRNALALVIPSRIEGWGLPAGEALSLGTPVISSTAPALKEVCGEHASYFDPDDVEQLAAQLKNATSKRAAHTRARRTSSTKRRNWHRVAIEAHSLLTSIVSTST